MIDPGPASPSHQEALVRALDGRRVTAILVTHCHSDHMGGNASVQRQFGCRTSLPAGEAGRAVDQADRACQRERGQERARDS